MILHALSKSHAIRPLHLICFFRASALGSTEPVFDEQGIIQAIQANTTTVSQPNGNMDAMQVEMVRFTAETNRHLAVMQGLLSQKVRRVSVMSG